MPGGTLKTNAYKLLPQFFSLPWGVRLHQLPPGYAYMKERKKKLSITIGCLSLQHRQLAGGSMGHREDWVSHWASPNRQWLIMIIIIIIIIILLTMFMVLSPGSFDECRLSAGWPPTLRPNRPIWAVSPPISCYHPQTPSPFIIIAQFVSRYSFYHPTQGGRLSRPRHCSKGAQPMPKDDDTEHHMALFTGTNFW